MAEMNPRQPTRPRKWKRTIRGAAAALLLLVGGAIVNVAACFGAYIVDDFRCSLQGRLVHLNADAVSMTAQQEIALRRYAEGAEFIKLAPSIGYSAKHGRLCSAYFLHNIDAPGIRVTITEIRFGWPLRSLQGDVTFVRGQQSVLRDAVLWEIPDWLPALPRVSTNPRVMLAHNGRTLFIPLQPIASGFIINTLFYALLLWLLFFAPSAARRMLRRKRGLCEKCAYPIGVSPVCTECGAPVRISVARSF